MTLWISWTLSALLVAVSLLPYLRAKVWWVRGWDFPRQPLAVLAALLALVQALVPGWGGAGAAAVSAAVFVYQAWWVYPYTVLAPIAVPQAAGDGAAELARVRLMVCNVLQTNRRAADLIALVRELDPDVLLVAETDPWWIGQLEVLESDYPHTAKCPLDNLYGMALYARWPLQDVEVQFLVEPDTPSIHALLVLPDGRQVRFVGLHPAPPSPTENEESTERDAELVQVGRSVARDERPVIVAGDLNDVAWSRTTRRFRRLSGLLDPRRGRGLFSTYPSFVPAFVRWPMDHLFHSAHFRLGRMQVLRDIGSDHFPILVELWLGPPTQVGEGPDPPDADDREQARQEMAEAGVRPGEVHVPRAE